MRNLWSCALLLLLSTANLLASDLTISSQVKGKGAFAKDSTQVQYLSATKMRLNQTGTKIDTVVDYGQEAIYTIDHGKKVVTKLTFKDMQEAMQGLEDQMAGMPEMVTKMMFGDVAEVKVEQLGPDTVLGRPCKKVRITLGKMIQEISLDPTLQMPIKDYGKAMSMLNRMPGQAGLLFKRMYEEMARLKGVSLRTHVSGLMGMDITTEATAVSTAPIPEATWVVPADYTQKDGGKELKGKR
jgi:hypothetical protein